MHTAHSCRLCGSVQQKLSLGEASILHCVCGGGDIRAYRNHAWLAGTGPRSSGPRAKEYGVHLEQGDIVGLEGKGRLLFELELWCE